MANPSNYQTVSQSSLSSNNSNEHFKHQMSMTTAMLSNKMSAEHTASLKDNVSSIKKKLLLKNKATLIKTCKTYHIDAYKLNKKQMIDAILGEFQQYLQHGTGKIAEYHSQRQLDIPPQSSNEDKQYNDANFMMQPLMSDEEDDDQVLSMAVADKPTETDSNLESKANEQEADDYDPDISTDSEEKEQAQYDEMDDLAFTPMSETESVPAINTSKSRGLVEGSRIWVKSMHTGKWRECTVLKNAPPHVYIHYISYSEFYDEWVDLRSGRVNTTRPDGNRLFVGDNFSLWVEAYGAWLEAEVTNVDSQKSRIQIQVVAIGYTMDKQWIPLSSKLISIEHRKHDDQPPKVHEKHINVESVDMRVSVRL